MELNLSILSRQTAHISLAVRQDVRALLILLGSERALAYIGRRITPAGRKGPLSDSQFALLCCNGQVDSINSHTTFARSGFNIKIGPSLCPSPWSVLQHCSPLSTSRQRPPETGASAAHPSPRPDFHPAFRSCVRSYDCRDPVPRRRSFHLESCFSGC